MNTTLYGTADEVARKLIDRFLESVPAKEEAEPEHLLYAVADAIQPIVTLALVSQGDLGARSFRDTLTMASAMLMGLSANSVEALSRATPTMDGRSRDTDKHSA